MKRKTVLFFALIMGGAALWFAPAFAEEKLPGAATIAGVPVLDDLPTTTPEFERRVIEHASLTTIASTGAGIYGGVTQLLLGDQLPLGPAPYTPWAKPLPGPKLRIIAISTVHANYDLAEIERRLDCQVFHIQVLQQYHYPKQYPELFEGYLAEQALKTLKRQADVILVAPNIRLFPEKVSRALLAKVEQGCGMVMTGGGRYGGGNYYFFWPLKDKIPSWVNVANHLVKNVDMRYKKFATITDHRVTSSSGLFDGVPFELMPTYHLFRMEANKGAEVLARDGEVPMAIGGHWGKGRALLLTWANSFDGFPIAEDNRVPRVDQYQEYYASAMIKAILWAAGRKIPLSFTPSKTSLPAGATHRLPIRVSGNIQNKTKLFARLRDFDCKELWTRTRPLKDGELNLKVPALPGGDYVLDIIARDRNGFSLGWGSYAIHAEAQGHLDIQLDKDRYLVGEPAVIAATVEGMEGALEARLSITDVLGRRIFEQEKAMQAGRAQWKYPNDRSVTVLHRVKVDVWRGGQPLLTSTTDLFVPRYQPDDFYCWLWPGSRPSYAQTRIYRRLRELLGFNVIMGAGYGGTHRASNYGILRSGALSFYSNIAPAQPEQMEKAPLATRKKVLDMVNNILPELRQLGGLALFFQDERHGSKDSEKPSGEALAEFRKYLARRYRDIEALNQTWGRSFRTFDEVVPVLTKEYDPSKEASLGPWMDWRLWALSEVSKTDRLGAARIRQAVETPCNLGIEGIFGLAGHNIPYGGTDLAAQSEIFNIAGPYGEHTLNACRSFFPTFLFSWAGYNQPYSRYQRYMWSCAFQGHGGIGFWYGPIYQNSTDCFYPQARWVRDLSRPLREGIGKLIMINRPPVQEPIAFLYSQPSLYAMAILGKTVDPENSHLFVRPASWARISLQRMLQDAGVQFGFISEKQLQQQKGQGLRMLILSSTVALEPATCRALESFVRGGGVVLADLCPGVWDNHGAYHQPGQLDSLFGVKRDQRFRFKTMASDWGVGSFESEPDFNIKGQWFIGQFYEETLKAADGRALGKHIFGPVKPPAFVLKRSGKGAALLMNFLETEYRRVPEHWQIKLATELLRLARVQSPVLMRNLGQNGEIIQTERKLFRWQDRGARYLGVLLDKGKNVLFELGRGGHVYELSRGVYFGKKNSFKLDMRDQPHALFAILPYRVDGLVLSPGKARLGQGLPLSLELKSTAKPVNHVVHLDVFRPDGTRCHPLSRNIVLADGHWQGSLPLALNDPKGRWRIAAREVVSGKTAEARVRVR